MFYSWVANLLACLLNDTIILNQDPYIFRVYIKAVNYEVYKTYFLCILHLSVRFLVALFHMERAFC